jgi:hypothetical protein
MRDALCLALHRAADDANGKPTKKLALVAAKLVEIALGGDVPAIKEIFDRVDGKVPLRTELTGANGGPVLTQHLEDDRESLEAIVARVETETKSREETRH